MSDNQEQQAPVFNIQRVYLKDLSLELPNAPQIFLETEQPGVEVAIDVGAQALAETVFEVTVTATVTTKIGDKVLYLVEGKQAGIFELANIPLEQLDPILGIACPGIIYPYLRSNIADAITRASMAPLHLAEVNFQAIYEQRVAQAAAEQQVAEAGKDSGLILPPGVGTKH
ncbi:protein-export chaperone SecB [Pigmentiphaga sp. NML080357]|uniref:protein-export chaperone SecB n=1 Tax=Pigmentiphaga sp. NML080357 TaxID=2008675 RepID=UPI000B40894B|nr:protein-export chaperone SecB [Pigmentiphaga sp. NML080357]OVZ55487.1 protein-export chaperone SecB [Pigmentiphaga sp. NML080357]